MRGSPVSPNDELLPLPSGTWPAPSYAMLAAISVMAAEARAEAVAALKEVARLYRAIDAAVPPVDPVAFTELRDGAEGAGSAADALQPGRCFVGRIVIPGMMRDPTDDGEPPGDEEEPPEPYYFYVVRRYASPLGGVAPSALLVRHKA